MSADKTWSPRLGKSFAGGRPKSDFPYQAYNFQVDSSIKGSSHGRIRLVLRDVVVIATVLCKLEESLTKLGQSALTWEGFYSYARRFPRIGRRGSFTIRRSTSPLLEDKAIPVTDVACCPAWTEDGGLGWLTVSLAFT